MEDKNLTVHLALLVENFVNNGKCETFQKFNTLYHLGLEGGKNMDT